MFDVRIMVEDKYLAKLLWALDMLKVGDMKVIPVRGAKAKNGKVVSSAPIQGGTLMDKIAIMIASECPVGVSSKTIGEMLERVGSKASNRTYIIKRLRLSGVLGKPKDHIYPVKQGAN